jgi:hypothetical protein
MSGSFVRVSATSSWSWIGAWSYSSPQCSATITMSAPLCLAFAAILSIRAGSMIGTDQGSADGMGMPFVPYVAAMRPTRTSFASTMRGVRDAFLVAAVPKCARPTRSKSPSVRWIPENPSLRLWFDAVVQAS